MKIKKVNELTGNLHHLLGRELPSEQSGYLLNFFAEVNTEAKEFKEMIESKGSEVTAYYKTPTITFISANKTLIVSMNFSTKEGEVAPLKAPQFGSKTQGYDASKHGQEPIKPLNPPKYGSRATSQYAGPRPKEIGERE